MDAQQDVFGPGYGRPFSDQEKVEINRIVDGVLQAAAGLHESSDKKGTQVSNLREAAKVANDGRKALIEFLRKRETDLAASSSVAAAIKTWFSGNATVEEAIERDLQSAERAEIDAISGRTHQQAEQDIRENDPHKIGAKAQAAANAPSVVKSSRCSRIVVNSALLVSLISLPILLIRCKRKVS